jgi:hypothetical protein
MLGLVLAAATMLGGCGLVVRQTSLSAISCGDITGAACDEQVAVAAARHPGATAVEILCDVGRCDRRGGAGTAVVTLANGAKVNDTFSYTGDPGPLPQPMCTGLAPDVCTALAASYAELAPTAKHIIGISITCSAQPCTRDKGEAKYTITLGDGTRLDDGGSWEGGLP